MIRKKLTEYGAKLDLSLIPKGQPLLLPMIEEFLRLSGDPDYRVFYSSSQSFCKGVTLGLLHKMPRVPAVFARKCRWRKHEPQEVAQDKDNYKSARGNVEGIQIQFKEEALLFAKGSREPVLESSMISTFEFRRLVQLKNPATPFV